MQKEVPMFSHDNKLVDNQLQILDLIEKKFSQKVDIYLAEPNIQIRFLNTQSGLESHHIHSLHIKALDFLKTFDAVITKSRHEEHSYWSYDTAVVKQSRLQDVINGLNHLPEANHKEIEQLRSGMAVAKC